MHKLILISTITIQVLHNFESIMIYCRLGLNLPALGDEDRKNMFAAMDENGDGDYDDNDEDDDDENVDG